MRVTVSPGPSPFGVRGREGRQLVRREPAAVGARPAAGRDDPGHVPAARDPAGVRRLRQLRLSRRTARATGQGARDHHRLEDERVPVLHRLTCDLVSIANIVEEPLIVIDDPASIAPRERLAVEYTRAAMHNSNNIPEPLLADIRGAISDPELVELSFLIGFINMLNLFNNLLDVRYDGEYALLAPSAT